MNLIRLSKFSIISNSYFKPYIIGNFILLCRNYDICNLFYVIRLKVSMISINALNYKSVSKLTMISAYIIGIEKYR